MAAANFHVHTNKSDGTKRSIEYVTESLIFQKKFFLGITDHDTIGGWEELERTLPDNLAVYHHKGYKVVRVKIGPNEGAEVEIFQGIELTTMLSDEKVHIVGLGIDMPDDNLLKRLDKINKERKERLEKLVYEINDKQDGIYNDVKIDWHDVLLVIGQSESPSRLHIGEALRKAGYGNTAREAMDKYVTRYLQNYQFDDSSVPTTEEGIQIIEKELRGVSVICHPEKISFFNNVKNLLIGYGVSAIEVQDFRFRDFVNNYNSTNPRKLLSIIGTDAHGEFDSQDVKALTYAVEMEAKHVQILKEEIQKRKV